MSKKICIFGDSIAQGYYDLEKGGWANRLNLFSLRKDEDKPIFNLGISGDTSFDLLERIENEVKLRKVKVIIFSIGVNDAGIENGESRIEIKIFRKNIEAIFKISEKFTSEIVFLGCLDVDEKYSTPVEWNENLYYYNKELKKYDTAIKIFCQEKNIIFIPIQGLLKKNELFDGVHPNAQGHEKIFQKVKNCLEENKII